MKQSESNPNERKEKRDIGVSSNIMTSIFRGKSRLFFFFKLLSTTYQYVTNISIKQKPKVYREKKCH